MPDLNAWPLETDVQALLESAGAWDSAAALSLAFALDAAVEEFESETGYSPFLNASAAETTRYFNAPGPIKNPHASLGGGGNKLFLGGGLLSISALLVDGVLQAPGVEYVDAQFQNNAPITMLRFPHLVFSKPNGISITGVWGYCSTLPKMAFNAVLARAAMKALPILANRRRVTAESETGLVKAIATGPVRTEYAVLTADKTSDFAALGLQLFDDWRRGVNRFRLVE